MTTGTLAAQTRDIVVDEIFPHSPETIWKALTTSDRIARWLMPAQGFEAIKGNRFTFMTKPAGAWDGTIECEILEVTANERLVYSWRGGDEGNVGYGTRLDTVVTWTLTKTSEGTRVRLVHSGFITPKNDTALTNMGEGWKKVVPSIARLLEEGQKS